MAAVLRNFDLEVAGHACIVMFIADISRTCEHSITSTDGAFTLYVEMLSAK